MKTTEIYEASSLARSVSKNFEIAQAFADAGHDKDAQYRIQIALASLHSLADHLHLRVEPVTADPARTLAYLDAGRLAPAE